MKMTKEEAIEILKEIEYPVNGDNWEYREMAFNIAIQALSKESCEDVVNRQAVKDWFCTNYCSEHNECEHFVKGDCNAMDELWGLPPVTPTQKMGYWIVTKKEKIIYAECSNCGALYPVKEDTYDFSSAKFCPNCGIKMIGSEDK